MPDINFIKKKVEFLYKREGFIGPVKALGRKIYYFGVRVPFNAVAFVWADTIRRRRFPTFSFNGKKYFYLYKMKNFTWMTERTIEVPLVLPYLQEAYANNKKVLEIGEVIRQFSEFKTHDIVDKYEYKKGVINIDVVDFKPKQKYDLVVSISTIEHVGWDAPEEPDPEKIPQTLRLVKEWLASGGRAVITMPIGYNSELDKRLQSGVLPFSKEYFFTRISKGNQWREATREEALAKKYGTPFHAANAIIMGIIQG
jgi:hypothetical protein